MDIGEGSSAAASANWTYESRDISIAIRLHEVLREKGWLVALPLNDEDLQHKLKQLNQLGFVAIADPGIQREPYAVDPRQPFLAAQKAPVREADQEPQLPMPDGGNRLIWYSAQFTRYHGASPNRWTLSSSPEKKILNYGEKTPTPEHRKTQAVSQPLAELLGIS